MNTDASVGKIARLPESVRDQLNQKLLDGAMGKSILPWLNSLPEVRQTMAAHFGARLITHQNLSEWRRRGYQRWLQKKDTEHLIRQLVEDCHRSDPLENLEQIGLLIITALQAAVQQLSDVRDGDSRWRRLQRICWEFARLQKIRTHGMSLQLQQDKARDTFAPLPPGG